jgi:gliding motility-associated-like protein
MFAKYLRTLFYTLIFLGASLRIDAQIVRYFTPSLSDVTVSGITSSSIGDVVLAYEGERAYLMQLGNQGELLSTHVIDANVPDIALNVGYAELKEVSPGVFILCGRAIPVGGGLAEGGVVIQYDLVNANVIWSKYFEHFVPTSLEVIDDPTPTLFLYGHSETSSTWEVNQIRRCDLEDGTTLSLEENKWTGQGNIMQLQATVLLNDIVYGISRNNYAGGGTSSMRMTLTRISESGELIDMHIYVAPIGQSARLYVSSIIEGPEGLAIIGRGDVNGTSTNKDIVILENDLAGNNLSTVVINGPSDYNTKSIIRYGDGYLCTGLVDDATGQDLFLIYVNDQDEIEWAKRSILPGQAGGFFFNLENALLEGDVLKLVAHKTNTGGPQNVLYIQQDLANFSDACCDVWSDLEGLQLTVLDPFEQLMPTEPTTSQYGVQDVIPIVQQPASPSEDWCSSSLEEYNVSEFICGSDSVLFGGQYYSSVGQYIDTLSCDSVVILDIIAADAPIVDLGPNQFYCSDDSVILYSPSSFMSYLWSDGTTADSLIVNQSGTVWLEVGDGFCTTRDSIHIEFSPDLAVDLGPDLVLCEGEEIELIPAYSVGSIPDDVLWQDGSTAPTFWVDSAGVYSVYAENAICSGQDSVTVSYVAVPVVDSTYQISVCIGAYPNMDDLPSAYSYAIANINLATTQFETPGTYEVIVSNNDCSVTSTLEVEVVSPPSVDLGEDISICDDSRVELIAPISGPGWEWQDGSTDESYVISQAGHYVYSIEHFCGLISDSVLVEVFNCDTSLYIPNAFTPDNDGVNDILYARGLGIQDFEFEIYDRWGHLVFQSFDIEQGWNGSVMGGDYYVEDGLYTYQVTYSFDSSLPTVNGVGKRQQFGFISIFR